MTGIGIVLFALIVGVIVQFFFRTRIVGKVILSIVFFLLVRWLFAFTGEAAGIATLAFFAGNVLVSAIRRSKTTR